VVEKIMKEINSLPENQKTALILKGIEGLSQKEIASILKIKEKALESLLSRARANLKKRL
jgi:RNA polymerase sigma factor (sigma-70 family)